MNTKMVIIITNRSKILNLLMFILIFNAKILRKRGSIRENIEGDI